MAFRDRWAREDCKDFVRFGQCRFGSGCRWFHGQPSSSHYILGRVKEIGGRISFNNGATDATFELHPSNAWLRQNAKAGDIVLFQVSSSRNERSRLRYGRVVSVLDPILHEEDECVNISEVDRAFTIDEPETQMMEDAISIASCDIHGRECTKIGLHIVAVASVYCNTHPEVPLFGEKVRLPRAVAGRSSFVIDEASLAISVYSHSDNTMSGPELSLVTVRRRYQNDTAERNCPEFQLLLERLVNQPRYQNVDSLIGFRKIQEHPQKFTASMVIEAGMRMYCNEVKTYLEESGNPPVISSNYVQEGSEFVSFCESNLNEFRRVLANSSNTAALAILGKMQGLEESMAFLQDFPTNNDKWRRRVDRVGCLPEGCIVKCTSPRRKLECLVNQQILIRSMLSSRAHPLYSRSDLLGMCGIRYSTPLCAKCIVGRTARDEFYADYFQFDNVPPTISRIAYSKMGSDEASREPESGSVVLTWKSLRCDTDDFMWEKVFRVNRQRSLELLRSSPNGAATLDVDLAPNQVCPYTNDEGVQLRLRPGIVVYMQVGERESKLHGGLGLRLLKIGHQCHVCLVHINHPYQAFMSDREDLQDFVTQSKLDNLASELSRQKTREVLLVESVEWEGRYYAGGRFNTDRPVAKGDFLCLRKDLTKYVWCAHGVVRDVEQSTVVFSTCTLFQNETDLGEDTGNTGEEWVIEVIHVQPATELDQRNQ